MYTPFLIGFNEQYGRYAHSGTEPSSVILSQIMKFKKLKSDYPKVPNKLKPKGMSMCLHFLKCIMDYALIEIIPFILSIPDKE